MKKAKVFTIPLLVACISSQAFSIDLSNLQNTGAGLTTGGEIDTNYVLSGTGAVGPDSYVIDISSDPGIQTHNNWVAAPGDSKWIGINADGDDDGTAPGTYAFTVTFDLIGASQDYLDNFEISGKWASDNDSNILLNPFGPYVVGPNTPTGFTALQDFVFDDGFVAGINRLVFVVDNDAGGKSTNPTGLLVTDLKVVPEPSTIAVVAVGLGLVGLVAYRRRKSAAAQVSDNC